MVLPGDDAGHRSRPLAYSSAGCRRNALRHSHRRRSANHPSLTAIRTWGGWHRRIAHYLADGEPAIAHNVGAGAAIAHDCRARLGNVRLRPARCRSGGSSWNILTRPRLALSAHGETL